MLQQVAVYVTGVIVVACIAVAVYRLVTRRSDPCAGCAGCDLKREFDNKRGGCGPEKGDE